MEFPTDSISPVDIFQLICGANKPYNIATHSYSGPALNAAKRVIQHLGGKLCLFQSGLPTLGEGALKMRENPRLLGSDKEHTMLNAEEM